MNLFFPMLVSGLLTGFHCVMMCGNMVLSYAVKGSEKGTLVQRMRPHFAYHLAKIASYTLVGLLLGSIGNFISSGARSWVSVIAGIYMVLLGLQMTGRFPALNRIQPKPPKFVMNALMRLRRKASKDASDGESTLITPVSFGLMTGIMPCGPLIAAQVAAAGSGSTVSGGLAMLGFGLGTAPIMLGYGAFASFLGVKFKKYMAVAGAVVILVLGAVMMNRGATALGLPINFNVVKNSIMGSTPAPLDESKFTTGADGVIEIPLVIEGSQYKPSTLVIPADKPVRLIVDRKDANLCSKELWFPNLGIRAPLTDYGVTTIDLPATTAGNYQMTCQMGMLSGTLQVGAGASSAKSPVSLRAAVVVLLFGAGFYFDYVRKREEEQKRAAKKRKGSSTPHPAPLPNTIFGLQKSEFMLAAAAIGLSTVLGLMLGGYFT